MQSSGGNRFGSVCRGRQLLAGLTALTGGLHANVACANWGENWVKMTWGFGGIPLPGLDGWGLFLLPTVLAAVALLLTAKRRGPRGPRMTLLMPVALAIPLTAYAAVIAVPNVFVNGTSLTDISSSGSEVGVWGSATTGGVRYGVYGDGGGVTGTSYGVYGTNADYGVYASGSTCGVYAIGSNYGVFANGGTNYVVYGNGDAFGVFGSGTTYALYASGRIYSTDLATVGTSNFLCRSSFSFALIGRCASSLRYKENVLDLALRLETVMQL